MSYSTSGRLSLGEGQEDVAEAADVSVNTVFNYFKTKEDLFFDRQDAMVESLGRVIASRREGESVVDALRRDFHEALDTQDWRYGVVNGADQFTRMVMDSPALASRMRQMHELRKEHLAQVLAETDADPDDPTPRFVAAQVVALTHAITMEYLRRRVAGEAHSVILPSVRAAADKAFAMLGSGIGDYPREDPSAAPVRVLRPAPGSSTPASAHEDA